MKKWLFLLFVCSATLSWGQSIFTNTVTDTDPSTSNPYTNGQTKDPNIIVTGIGRGSEITAASVLNRY